MKASNPIHLLQESLCLNVLDLDLGYGEDELQVLPQGCDYFLDDHDLLHNDNGPAVVCHNRFRHNFEMWCQHGKFHRLDGPAILYGKKVTQYWQNGLLHRENGPATIIAGFHGFTQKAFYLHGLRYVPGRGESIIDTNEGKKILQKNGSIVTRSVNHLGHGRADFHTLRPDGSEEYQDHIKPSEDASNYHFEFDSSDPYKGAKLYWKNIVVFRAPYQLPMVFDMIVSMQTQNRFKQELGTMYRVIFANK